MFLIKLFFCLLLYYSIDADKNEIRPSIISRHQWTSTPVKNINYLITPIPYVIIHHTATPECYLLATCSTRVENIRHYHMDELGWNDIGYSFIIGGDNNIYEGCGWIHEGAHTFGYNKKSIAIAFIGDFQDKKVNETIVEKAHKLIDYGKAEGILRDDVYVLAGRQVINTASPGYQLFTQIKEWPEWMSSP